MNMARNFARGAPPPRGSIEYAGVGDMWEPSRTAPAKPHTSADAVRRWLGEVDRAAATVPDSDAFVKWATWRKTKADLAEARPLYLALVAAGASTVPLPYGPELRDLVKKTASAKTLDCRQMGRLLLAAQKCAEKMLDPKAPWASWYDRDRTGPLRDAAAEARRTAEACARSGDRATYKAGHPARDEVTRRLAEVWVAAADLSGMREPAKTASAGEAASPARSTTSSLLWVLGLGGAAYLGVAWLGNRWLYGRGYSQPADAYDVPKVAVPDALIIEED